MSFLDYTTELLSNINIGVAAYNFRHGTNHASMPSFFSPFESKREAFDNLIKDAYYYYIVLERLGVYTFWSRPWLSVEISYFNLCLAGFMSAANSIVHFVKGIVSLCLFNLDDGKTELKNALHALNMALFAITAPAVQLIKFLTRSVATVVDLCHPKSVAVTCS